ncbi:MAG TPA: 2-oxoacid:acceptor oxidoreductase family protein [Kiritimatiellia bacterium]|nr:2-oxoacid:acceptor oxidoreductase family protein [Kiritimatiellia bacterium]HPC48981.1 2-oxoacid:acceptor oxidoreductase family protein [Kiritimatiellia bacterium]HPW75731.1 2-oxoacid:acceptor oxidoreductase family protein [Kiritimatiellia bacterium]HRU20269.1 2-oxoacid:acceptor oxidoreductase family protein [Kiritimatiellia bacterium]
MTEKKTVGMYETFVRSGKETRSTHYCAGCGHGIIHKLITEALTELGIQDRTIIVNPIGCAVFGYYYWDCGNVGAAHGRAPSVGTAINRVRRNAVVISYQGDGDLGAIGFNNTFQAASRGEHMAVFFVNNAIYGMTGGQMAPTTLEGMKTATSPFGRDPLTAGYPLHVCEVLDQLKAPVYIERVSVADTKRIMQAKRAVRKALEIQRDGKGYAFVEFLSPCPTNLGMDANAAALFCVEQMEREYPLGCLRDLQATAQPRPAAGAAPSVEAYFGASTQQSVPEAVIDETFGELRLKFTGYGGQGILSLGVCVAEAARLERRFTTWFPTYGPEQRGGSAACSVVLSGRPIGSPAVDHPDVLVCMNQPSFERFAKDVKPGGTVIVDATVPQQVPVPEGVRVVTMPAIDLAIKMGVPKAANTMMLAALARTGVTRLQDAHLLAALDASFKNKPALVEKNRLLMREAEAWLDKNAAL